MLKTKTHCNSCLLGPIHIRFPASVAGIRWDTLKNLTLFRPHLLVTLAVLQIMATSVFRQLGRIYASSQLCNA